MIINNINQLSKLKELKWSNPYYTQRSFEINSIDEFKYLLDNYLDRFAFKVTYNTFEYTIYKKDNYIYIRNNDTYKFKNKYEGIITEEYSLKDSNIENVIDFIVSSQNENNKRRTKIKFIYIDDDITDEIKQLLNKGLIKYFYGEDSYEPSFIYLAENENAINNVLTSNYFISDIIEQMKMMFDSAEMVVKNLWDDKIYLYHTRIEDCISDDLYSYIPEDKQKEIFSSKNPSEKITEIFNEIGRNQLKMQIEGLLKEVNNAKFN